MEIQLASTPFGSRRMSFALLAAQKKPGKSRKELLPTSGSFIAGYAKRKRSLASMIDRWPYYRRYCPLPGSYAYRRGQSCRVPVQQAACFARTWHGGCDLATSSGSPCGSWIDRASGQPERQALCAPCQRWRIADRFRLSLAPLLARAPEFEAAAEEIKTAKAQLREMREQLTLLRRDIAKLIEFALIEGLEGPWAHLNQRFRDIVEAIPRRADVQELAMLVEQMREIRENVDKLLKTNKKAENLSGNESQNERQLNESKPDSHFDETALSHEDQRVFENSQVQKEPSISLDMVLRACPEIETYASGSIRIWQDLIETAGKVRIFLGIDNKLYDMATKTLGIHNAAITIAYILQRYDHIRSAGGYLRILSEKAASGAFSIKPLMMSAMCNRKQPARC